MGLQAAFEMTGPSRFARLPAPARLPDPVAGLPPMPLCGGDLELRAVPADSPERPALEAFIRLVFQDHFGARLERLMPHLLGLYDRAGEVRAAVGLRSAAREPLFLEQYLAEPVERVIGQRLGVQAERASVVEVGSLATRGAGVARLLFQALTLALAARGAPWMVCTGTRGVRAVFERLGLPVAPLCAADPARLGGSAAGWGHYYAHAPEVLVGYVPSGLPSLDAALFAPDDRRLLALLRGSARP
jgi:hypothetical protein